MTVTEIPAAYDAAAIETLEDLEAVRKRPGMYIGGTGSDGLMHLVVELIDNAVDEAAAGSRRKVGVILHRDGSVSVADNGRGIPIDRHGKRKISALEVVFTELHAGGKFGGGAYSASGGLHGVGASVVNALSTRLTVQVDRDGSTHELSFRDRVAGQYQGSTFRTGHRVAKVASVPATRTGTRVRFWPDLEIFDPTAGLDFAAICERLTQACFLVPDMRIEVADRRAGSTGEIYQFVSKGGLSDLVQRLSGNDDSESGAQQPVSGIIVCHKTDSFTEKVPVDGKTTEVRRDCVVEAALRWVSGYDTTVVSFVNTIPTPNGGTHMAGFDKALTRVVNSVLLKDNRTLAQLNKHHSATARNGSREIRATKDDVQEGLVAAVKVTFPEPQFRGQTKQELGTPAIEGIVASATYEQVKGWFEPGGGPRSHVKAIADKLATAVAGRVASKQLLDNKRKAASLGSTGLPDKLADCRVHGPDAELIVVEGDSAAGPAKRGRDSQLMAILPLRGKILNAAKATSKQVLDNAEAKALFTAMGAGIAEDFRLENARYGRIVILCDADVDGSHIRCLLLTLIHGYMRPMLEAGRVFAAVPPLYTTKVGDKVHRAYSDAEREQLTEELSRGKRKPRNIRWQRFKGLGEMNVDELRHCALNPATRTLRRLTLEDAAEATRMVDVLMGNDVAKRRDFLRQHSELVDFDMLDI